MAKCEIAVAHWRTACKLDPVGREIAQSTINARVRRAVPESLKNWLRLLRSFAKLIRSDACECTLCGYTGRFWPFGDPPRPSAICSNCGSLERHRLMALWIEENRRELVDTSILHFAPEPVLARVFKKYATHYRGADVDPTYADTVLNMEDIDLPDQSVDLVVCSHVLEHVDDAKALSEVYRILTSGGRALLMFPIVEGWDHTYENPAHTSALERTKYFGQADHVRMFGRDVRNRIKNVGFALSELTAEEPEVSNFGLIRGEKLFIAMKA